MTMRTLHLPVDPNDLSKMQSQASLAQAAEILRNGGTVAFPTETVYGLGANALDASAVSKIFEAKQRPDWDPLIVHIAVDRGLDVLAATVSEADRVLIKAFWPGPLTLLLPKRAAVQDIVTAGRSLVGVRLPSNIIARRMIELAGLPIAAPSANSFGRTSPTTAQHVLEDLDGRIDAILDGGPTTLGLESTVIDANADPPVVYRHGMISIEEIREYLPDAIAFVATGMTQRQAFPSPGVGLRHYAPRARLVLVDEHELSAALAAAIEEEGLTGVLLPDEFTSPASTRLRIFHWGSWGDVERLAQRLFLGLRELDRKGVVRILCPVPVQAGLGSALRDRLRKAAIPRD